MSVNTFNREGLLDGVSEWEMAIRREFETREQRERPHRIEVLELSRHDPLLGALIDAWKHGYLTWEQALCQAVTGLAEVNRRLADKVTHLVRSMPPHRLPSNPHPHSRKDPDMSKIIGASEDQPKTPYTPPALNPIGNRVVVQADVLPELTRGGIALPNSVVGKRASRMGTVIAVGPGMLRFTPAFDENGNPLDRQPMQCKVGDRVIIPQTMDRVQMDLDDETSELVILSEDQLLAIFA